MGVIQKAAFTRMYGNMTASLSEEDLKAIEDCQTDSEADEKIKALYTENTGKNPDSEMQDILDEVAAEYIKELQKKPTDNNSSY